MHINGLLWLHVLWLHLLWLYLLWQVLEGSMYINGSPQNTFVPGVIELAERCGSELGRW